MIKFREPKQGSKPVEKPKTINDLLSLVSKWRRNYIGKFKETGEYEQQGLEESAISLGVPKKTLDDYLFQIR